MLLHSSSVARREVPLREDLMEHPHMVHQPSRHPGTTINHDQNYHRLTIEILVDFETRPHTLFLCLAAIVEMLS